MRPAAQRPRLRLPDAARRPRAWLSSPRAPVAAHGGTASLSRRRPRRAAAVGRDASSTGPRNGCPTGSPRPRSRRCSRRPVRLGQPAGPCRSVPRHWLPMLATRTLRPSGLTMTSSGERMARAGAQPSKPPRPCSPPGPVLGERAVARSAEDRNGAGGSPARHEDGLPVGADRHGHGLVQGAAVHATSARELADAPAARELAERRSGDCGRRPRARCCRRP